MDAEFREAFAKLSSQIADVGRDAKQAVQVTKETDHRLAKLEAVVYGDNPPPSTNGHTPLTKKVSNSELEVDSVKAELILVNKKLDEMGEKVSFIHSTSKVVKNRFVKFFNDPAVKTIGRIVVAAIIAWGVGKGYIHK